MSRLRRIASYIYTSYICKRRVCDAMPQALFMCVGRPASRRNRPPKLSMVSLYGEDVLRAPDPRMRAKLGVKRVASLDGGQLRRLAGRQIIAVDISTGGGYTILRRFWREYLRTPCSGEGGGADYLLFCTSSRSYRYDLPSASFRIRSVPP